MGDVREGGREGEKEGSRAGMQWEWRDINKEVLLEGGPPAVKEVLLSRRMASGGGGREGSRERGIGVRWE